MLRGTSTTAQRHPALLPPASCPCDAARRRRLKRQARRYERRIGRREASTAIQFAPSDILARPR
jgi:hypothetical protein